MRIQFQDKVYEMPVPVDNESEVIIKVEKYAFIRLPAEKIAHRFHFPNPFAKSIFFMIHEGIGLTFHKVKSSLLQRKIIAQKQVVFAYGQIKDTNRFAIAVGPQDCPYAEYLSFPKALTIDVSSVGFFNSPTDRNVVRDYQIVLDYFTHHQEQLELLYHYSPYSGKKRDFKLESILNENTNNVCGVAANGLKSLEIPTQRNAKQKRRSKVRKNKFDLFLAGAGAYAWTYILPSLKGVNFHTVIDLNPILASVMGEKYGFLYKDTSSDRALARLRNSENPILIVATYHSTHLPIIEQALSINPNTKVFLEKPPVTTEEQLEKLIALRESSKHFIEIGYNRRYSPWVYKAKRIMSDYDGPITMTCIVKELPLPLSHWYYWPNQGTRVTGNLSHWIDLGIYFIQHSPVSITAISASDKFPTDEISVAVLFEDGSLLTLIASDRGNLLRGVQEYIDIRRANLTITIDDFLRMKVQKGSRQKGYRKLIRDKGHKRMYESFIHQVKDGSNANYPNNDLNLSTRLYLSISRLLLSNIYSIDLITNHDTSRQ